MEKQNLYFMSLATLLLASDIALALLQEKSLDIYLGLFALSYLLCALVFEPKWKTFNFVGLGLVGIWVVASIPRVLPLI